MKMHHILSAAIAVLLAAMPAKGQQSPGTYTLEHCIDIGLKNNIQMLQARNDVKRSETFQTEAYGEFLPGISARGSWTRYDREQIGFRGDGIFTSRNSYSYNVQAGLTLFDGMRNFNTVDQSLLNFKSAEQGLIRTREDIVFRIQQSYYNTLRFKQLTTVAESNLERSRGQLDRIREMNAVGSVPQADVYRQQVTVGNDELSLIEARNNYQNSLVDFQALLGIEPSPDFQLEEEDTPFVIDDAAMHTYRTGLGSFSEMVTAAIETRADFRQAELNVRSAEKGVSIARSGHFPSVSAFAQYTWNNLELADFEVYDRFFYGISVSVPIFSNFQISSNVQRSKIMLWNTEYVSEQLRRTISTEIMRAMNNLEMAEKNVEISGNKLQSAREDQRTAQERYNLGAGTLLDLITANANLTLAEADVVNATFNYLTAQKQMDYQLGRIQY